MDILCVVLVNFTSLYAVLVNFTTLYAELVDCPTPYFCLLIVAALVKGRIVGSDGYSMQY